MFDPDHWDPVLVHHRENEAQKALVVGVQVEIPFHVRQSKVRRGTLITIYAGSDFPFEVLFHDGTREQFAWWQLEVFPPHEEDKHEG